MLHKMMLVFWYICFNGEKYRNEYFILWLKSTLWLRVWQNQDRYIEFNQLLFYWSIAEVQYSVQFSCLVMSNSCNPMNRSMPGFPVHHQLPEFTQTHVHPVSDAIQPSHPLSSPSPASNPSQHQGLFQWVNSSNEVAKVLAFQLQHQSFQWTCRADLL